MRLTTEYREKIVGTFNKTKQYYLVCWVEFTNEERAVIEERGLYDHTISVPAASPPPTRSYDFVSMLMRVAGVVLIPVGLLVSCGAAISGPPAVTQLAFMAAIGGIVLFFVGKNRDTEANKRVENDYQTLTLRTLITNHGFQAHAYSITEAQEFETDIRDSLTRLRELIQANTVVPERNTYEI